mmetsp:Transcript_25521/g.64890  ORF Transcript_25521/g.64890 Transcript_25521/m.64890 type:complete len:222 (-) Transcript_25521:903-1568(-)
MPGRIGHCAGGFRGSQCLRVLAADVPQQGRYWGCFMPAVPNRRAVCGRTTVLRPEKRGSDLPWFGNKNSRNLDQGNRWRLCAERMPTWAPAADGPVCGVCGLRDPRGVVRPSRLHLRFQQGWGNVPDVSFGRRMQRRLAADQGQPARSQVGASRAALLSHIVPQGPQAHQQYGIREPRVPQVPRRPIRLQERRPLLRMCSVSRRRNLSQWRTPRGDEADPV